jgi:hypothetical protein
LIHASKSKPTKSTKQRSSAPLLPGKEFASDIESQPQSPEAVRLIMPFSICISLAPPQILLPLADMIFWGIFIYSLDDINYSIPLSMRLVQYIINKDVLNELMGVKLSWEKNIKSIDLLLWLEAIQKDLTK